MISGRTFTRGTIALRQREAKHAGRILPPSVLELSLKGAVQPDIIFSGSALRKQKPQYLLLQPAMPLPRDERLIDPSHHPVR